MSGPHEYTGVEVSTRGITRCMISSLTSIVGVTQAIQYGRMGQWFLGPGRTHFDTIQNGTIDAAGGNKNEFGLG